MDPLAVALNVRLYRLLADRPEFQTHDVGERIDKAWTRDAPGSLALLDRVLVIRASNLDRLCGYAVRTLRMAAAPAVLDVLGVLEPARIVAMYCALPAKRRYSVLRDAAWGYHVQRADLDAVAEGLAFWDDMPDLLVPADLSAAGQSEFHTWQREIHRAAAGLLEQSDDVITEVP